MFTCKITLENSRDEAVEYAVTKDESSLDLSNNIISADSRFGRKLYDMVNSGRSTFKWEGVECIISEVVRYRTCSEMRGYGSPEGKKIAEVINNNKVKYLVHFTRIENLSSILEHGILSVQELDSMKLPYINNDFGRYDSRKDCSCFSIEFPNDSLLKSFQKRQTEHSWVVFLIDVSVLISSDTEKQFCIHNAATKGISQKIKFNQLRTPEEFQNMFSKQIEFNKRDGEYYMNRTVDKSYLTTSNQAEILIKGVVDRNYIRGIISRTQADKIIVDLLVSKFDTEQLIDSVLEPRYFEPRCMVKFKER